MSKVAQFDTTSADAYVEKSITANANYKITFDARIDTMADLGPFDLIELGDFAASSATGLYPHYDTGSSTWVFQSYAGANLSAVPIGSWFTIEADVTNVSGTTWNVVWKLNGSTMTTDSGFTFTNDASQPLPLVIGCRFGGTTPGPTYYFRNVSVTNGAGSTTYFSDDFSSGGLSNWDLSSGAASVIDDPFAGAVTFPTGADPKGVSVSFGSDSLAATPTWSYVDSTVQRWRIRRGRAYMTDRTETGTAEAEFVDTAGALDPTNSTGPFYPMNPNCPFAIGLKNPVASTWTTIFRGMLQQMPTTMDISEQLTTGTLMADDLFSLLAVQEIPKSVDFSSANTGANSANTIGDTTYAAQDVQSRIKAVLADAGVPAGLTNIFSGNVNVQPTVEPPGTTVLSMIWDAADAEFPAVSNVFIGKDGVVNFRGRLARFNPTDPTYNINTWHVGDTAAVATHSSWALISGMTFDRDVAKIINDSSFQPQGIADADIAGQTVQDSGSITQYGTRSLTGQDLITAGGIADGKNALDETKLFSSFFVDNFHDAQTRITQLTFRGQPNLDAPNAAAQWLFLCGVEISDQVVVTTTHPGGGGFSAEPYFVEGISYEAEPMGVDPDGDPLLDVTLTLDLSPAAYYTTNPF